MATYLTPGVYVEELPSPNKPIEGVSTSTAAFVGLAPAGPLNEPVQIANWSQFVDVFSDPDDPEERGPYLAGAYLAHAVHGFFTNGGTLCWVVRVGGEGEPQLALPAETKAETKDKPAPPGAGKEKPIAFNVTPKDGAGADVRLELTLDPPKPKVEHRPNGGEPAAGAQKDTADASQSQDPTYTLVVSSGSIHEQYTSTESEPLTAANLPGVVDKLPSQLIELKATAGDLQPVPGTYHLNAPVKAVDNVLNDAQQEIEGKGTKPGVFAGLAAIEDISIVCVPDAVAIAKEDDTLLRGIQTGVIAHCEDMEDRVAVLDTPRDKNPSEALQWRMYTAGYDSKQATLYWPWLEVWTRCPNGR